ncbi:MAG: class I SAM-dependent methyltransferase [Alphaproteobacteria bacterium]
MSVRQAIVAQFRQPHGPVGGLAGWVMANRSSNRDRNKWTVDLLDIDATTRVLEIGCGPGLALNHAAARAHQGLVVGVDHSMTMLRQAARRNDAAVTAGRLALLLGSIDNLPAFQSTFDRIFSVNVVQFLDDKSAAFRTMYGLLAPSGVLATTYMPRSRNPTRDNALKMADVIANAMTGAGFDSIRFEELVLKPVSAVCVVGRRPA